MMATPRSLRSFFDFTTPDLLDADFSTLQLISRANHDALQTELATLRSQIAEKNVMLSTMFIQQHGTPGEFKSPAAESPIDFGIREAQMESLTAKVDALLEQKRKLTLALETAQAKSRALTAEVKNMRERQAREEHEKKYAALEAQYRAIASELEARRAENDRFALERSTLTAKVRALESGGGLGAAAAVANTEGMEALKTENERLMLRLKAFEDGNAALNKNIAAQNKTIGVLRTVAKTNEQCNVDLQKKNLDLVAEMNTTEAQYEQTMKKNIVLETKNSELEDEKAAIMAQLKKLTDKSETASQADTKQMEAWKKRFEESEKTFRARINQLEDNIKRQGAAIKQYQEKTQYLTDNNARFLEDKKAVEKKLQSVQVERARLDSELVEMRVKLFRVEKSVITTTRSLDLEAANKKLIDQNQYLSRRFETQTQTHQTLKNEIITLEERSERMLGEIHTLRQDKARLNDDIDNLISQRNGRRGSTERNDQLELFPIRPNGAKNSNGSATKLPTPISPKTTRGTKRAAEDQDDTAQTPTTSRSNFNIRALADTPKTPQAAQPISTHPPPSPPGQRSLFDRVKQPLQHQQPSDPRSLFDRINTNTSIDHEIDTLITASKDLPRGVFCRFRGPPPGVADLLDLISGGPIESVRIAQEKDVAFLWFLRPSDASTFMAYSAAKKLPNIEFSWNEKPVRTLEKDLATQVVRYGASRVLILHCVPHEVQLQRITSDVGGKRIGFWLYEGASGKVTADGRAKGREVVIEFTELRDAVEARKRLGGDFWCEASWIREGCDRAVPTVE